MSRVTPDMRDFAERLIAYETKGNKSSGAVGPPAFLVCERLRPHLATLMGSAGVRALLARALALATAEIPALRAVETQADGSMQVLAGSETQVTPGKLAEGGVVLVAQLVALLTTFIGENLMLRILRNVWPDLPRENHSD